MKFRKHHRVQAFSGRPTEHCSAIHEIRLANEIIIQTRISPCIDVDKMKNQIILISISVDSGQREDRKHNLGKLMYEKFHIIGYLVLRRRRS
jgi:hypothetical protein